MGFKSSERAQTLIAEYEANKEVRRRKKTEKRAEVLTKFVLSKASEGQVGEEFPLRDLVEPIVVNAALKTEAVILAQENLAQHGYSFSQRVVFDGLGEYRHQFMTIEPIELEATE